jgi:energy-coupling factor transport system permease protein
MADTYHPLTWLLWAVSAATLAFLTLNPLYLALLGLAAAANYLAVRRRSPLAQSWGAFIKLGMLIWLVTIPLNALMAHQGRYVLFTLPPSLPLIGGHITLEGAVYGFVRGLSLIVLLTVFAAFNSAVDQARLLRRMPAFLYLVSMVTSIAMAFVPQMVTVMKDIREAQRIRGHQFKGLRDLLPLFVPLLTTGMERAIQLAESMEARGFGGALAAISAGRELAQKVLTFAALLVILFGVFAASYWDSRRWIGIVITLAGAACLLAVFWSQSRRVKRSHYRRERWLPRDWLVIGLTLFALSTLILLRWVDRTALFYYSYPPYVIWPAFNPLIGALFLPFIAPAILLPVARRDVMPPPESMEMTA